MDKRKTNKTVLGLKTGHNSTSNARISNRGNGATNATNYSQSPEKQNQHATFSSQSSRGGAYQTNPPDNSYHPTNRELAKRRDLPGKGQAQSDDPSKVDNYDIFYFETRMRSMMEEYMDPIQKSFKEDKKALHRMKTENEDICKRLKALEQFSFLIKEAEEEDEKRKAREEIFRLK